MAKKASRIYIRAKNREYFTSSLALLLKADVSIEKAFESLRQSTGSWGLRRAIRQIQSGIDGGLSLWLALSRSGVMSAQTLALVRLGEISGNLTENLQVAALQEERQRLFRSKIRSALLYPSLVLSITIIVGLGVAWFLLPRLSDTFSSLRIPLPFVSLVFMNLGDFLRQNGAWAVPAVLLTALTTGYLVFFAPKTEFVGQWILFRTPGIASLLQEVEISRFGYLLSTLLDSGLNITTSFDMLEQATSYKAYKKFYAYLRKSFEEGYSLASSLPRYKSSKRLLPAPVQQMLMAAERSGGLPDTLRSVGNIYEQKSDTTAQYLGVILEPILLIIVWLCVLGVAVAVILPIYSLIGGLN